MWFYCGLKEGLSTELWEFRESITGTNLPSMLFWFVWWLLIHFSWYFPYLILDLWCQIGRNLIGKYRKISKISPLENKQHLKIKTTLISTQWSFLDKKSIGKAWLTSVNDFQFWFFKHFTQFHAKNMHLGANFWLKKFKKRK